LMRSWRRRDRRCSAWFVQLRHLVPQAQQVVLPAFTLSSHLDSIWTDHDTTRHPPRQLLDVEEPLRVDADDDVVAVCDHAAQTDATAAELHTQRVGEVVELRRCWTITIL